MFIFYLLLFIAFPLIAHIFIKLLSNNKFNNRRIKKTIKKLIHSLHSLGAEKTKMFACELIPTSSYHLYWPQFVTVYKCFNIHANNMSTKQWPTHTQNENNNNLIWMIKTRQSSISRSEMFGVFVCMCLWRTFRAYTYRFIFGSLIADTILLFPHLIEKCELWLDGVPYIHCHHHHHKFIQINKSKLQMLNIKMANEQKFLVPKQIIKLISTV